MKKFILLSIVFWVLSFSGVFGQVLRETRAIWLTTNFRLDWPPANYNQEIQKKELIKIFDDLKDKKFNTIYFQVRINGTVLYKSSYEPFSYYLTGEVGGTPNYDPLDFAIKEAHARGMELHAWVNIINTFSGSEQKILSHQNHLFNTHRDWLIEWYDDNKKSYWIDPGIPEAREYLTNLVTEIAATYDVDGLHFDFLRYPGRTFKDNDSYLKYGNNGNKDDWRRNNLTGLVESIYSSVKSIKPLIKIGAAPIGIYKNTPGATGWEGYSEVYQDSRLWLKLGIIDYLVPQIYWGFKKNPRFDVLANDWQDNSSNRTVILGIGAYQESVYPEMDKMIELSRKINSGGIAFFRYGNIKNYNFKLFNEFAYPNLMPWIELNLPSSPANLQYTISGTFSSNIFLSWKKPIEKPELVKYYSIYRLNNPDSPFNSTTIYDIISGNKESINIPMHRPRKIKNYFAVKSLNILWNESAKHSEIAEVIIPQLYEFSQTARENDKMILVSEENNGVIILNSLQNDTIEITGTSGEKKGLLFSKPITKGKNLINIENINKYSTLSINYKSTNKNFELKLQ